jgi:hypothetical protein
MIQIFKYLEIKITIFVEQRKTKLKEIVAEL